MLHLRVYGLADSLTEIGEGLEDHGAARNVALSQGVRAGHVLLTAEVSAEWADRVLELLVTSGVAEEDIALARFDEIGPIRPRHPTNLIWTDVLGQARANAQPVARYLVFMVAAGVIAGFGVIEANEILIVGAMAVSPDLLPITAACVGLVSRRGRLATHALVTLAVGMGATCLTAALITVVLDLVDLLPASFEVGESALSGLTTVNSSTIGVALAAGVAGMLAMETRASAAVGVCNIDHHDPGRRVSRRGRGRRRGGRGTGRTGRPRRQRDHAVGCRHTDAVRTAPARRERAPSSSGGVTWRS